MIDRTSKIILAVIAVGLWANVATTIFAPTLAVAQSFELGQILNITRQIQGHLSGIYSGICLNSKIC
jgi:hydrogenase/urease accessory protein HupE